MPRGAKPITHAPLPQQPEFYYCGSQFVAWNFKDDLRCCKSLKLCDISSKLSIWDLGMSEKKVLDQIVPGECEALRAKHEFETDLNSKYLAKFCRFCGKIEVAYAMDRAILNHLTQQKQVHNQPLIAGIDKAIQKAGSRGAPWGTGASSSSFWSEVRAPGVSQLPLA